MRNLLGRIGRTSKHRKCSTCEKPYTVRFLPLIFRGVSYKKVPFLCCDTCNDAKEVKGVMWYIQQYPHDIKDFSGFFRKSS